MRRNRRRLPIPQFEFGYADQAFRLIQETGLDGERVARECAKAERARAIAEAGQAALFSNKKSKKRL